MPFFCFLTKLAIHCINLYNELYIYIQKNVEKIQIMKYRLNSQTLLDVLGQWNSFIRRKIHLIACGGTALTLLGVKESTKDVDFMVPNESEHRYLTKILKDLGYRQTTGSGWNKKGDLFIFDLFKGNCWNLLHEAGLYG